MSDFVEILKGCIIEDSRMISIGKFDELSKAGGLTFLNGIGSIISDESQSPYIKLLAAQEMIRQFKSPVYSIEKMKQVIWIGGDDHIKNEIRESILNAFVGLECYNLGEHLVQIIVIMIEVDSMEQQFWFHSLCTTEMFDKGTVYPVTSLFSLIAQVSDPNFDIQTLINGFAKCFTRNVHVKQDHDRVFCSGMKCLAMLLNTQVETFGSQMRNALCEMIISEQLLLNKNDDVRAAALKIIVDVLQKNPQQDLQHTLRSWISLGFSAQLNFLSSLNSVLKDLLIQLRMF